VDIEITLKNYRCFPDTDPAHFIIREGEPVAFVGVNNAGKSSLIRFFYEFRSYLAGAIEWLTTFTPSGSDNRPNNAMTLLGVNDPLEAFHNGNDRDLQLTISARDPGTIPLSFEITIERQTQQA